MLDEREFELVNIIGAEIASNQRDLSRHMDLSLGMTNMLIKRLISKGYIRIKQLNKRKVEYILTPKGFAEKMKKSVKYTLKTLQSIGLIKEQLRKIVLPLYEKGERHFYILGESDFAHLIEIVLREKQLKDYTINYILEMPEKEVEGVLFICREDVDYKHYKGLCVDLITVLSENSQFISFNSNHKNHIGSSA